MTNSRWRVQDIPDQKGRVAIVTGSTSGLGKETARILASKNARVILAVRNTQKGERVAEEIRKAWSKADVSVRRLDLACLDSIRTFCNAYIMEFNRLDLLINNAGIMMCPYNTTKDGFEIQMGTNHLGHFALTGQLLPVLKNTDGSRVVALSSFGHKIGNIDFSDFNWTQRKYNKGKAYGDSKLANLYFTYELARKLNGNESNPTVTAAHPGWTATELQRHVGLFGFLSPYFAQKADMGALPTLRAAIDPNAKSGDYFGPDGFLELWGAPVKVRSSARSHDISAARKLWELSEELTGVVY